LLSNLVIHIDVTVLQHNYVNPEIGGEKMIIKQRIFTKFVNHCCDERGEGKIIKLNCETKDLKNENIKRRERCFCQQIQPVLRSWPALRLLL
jgi:hypothetical protein